MYCPNCKKAFPDGHAFCDSCGGKLVSEYANPSPQPNYQPAPNYNPQPSYSAPQYAVQPQNDQVVSTVKWLGIFCLNLIPIIGSLIYLILLFVWAFGNTRQRSLKNWARATLILALIGIILSVIIAVFLWPAISDLLYNNFNIDLSNFGDFSY